MEVKIDTTLITINHLIEANISELIFMRPYLIKKSFLDYYCQIMEAYYLNNEIKLSRLCITLSKMEDSNFRLLDKFAFYRKKMLRCDVSEKDSLQLIIKGNNTLLDGEIHFCTALGLYRIKKFELAKKLFSKAYILFADQGIVKKSLLSMLNVITTEGNINNKYFLISSYHYYIEHCLKFGACEGVANAYYNIANEHLKMGTNYSAYKYCELSIGYLKSVTTTYQMNESLLLKLDILYFLGRIKEANILTSQLERDNNIQILCALKVIQWRHCNKSPLEKSLVSYLSSPWKARIIKPIKRKPFGKVEDILIDYLSIKKRNYRDIINYIYPNVNEDNALNRLTTIVTRINYKYKKMIIHDVKNDFYFLSNNQLIIFDGIKND